MPRFRDILPSQARATLFIGSLVFPSAFSAMFESLFKPTAKAAGPKYFTFHPIALVCLLAPLGHWSVNYRAVVAECADIHLLPRIDSPNEAAANKCETNNGSLPQDQMPALKVLTASQGWVLMCLYGSAISTRSSSSSRTVCMSKSCAASQ